MRRMWLTCAVIATAVAATLSAPAQAAPAEPPNGGTRAALEPVSAVYTDLADPLRAIPVGSDGARVGAWLDKGLHSAKVYLTYDLTAMHGTDLLTAHLFATESAGDCERTRLTEAWVVDSRGKPSWLNPPRERIKLAGPQGTTPCPGYTVAWPADELVRAAVAQRRTRLTIGLRMPGAAQFNPADSRTYRTNPLLLVRYNRAPTQPTGLRMTAGGPNYECGSEPHYIFDRKPWFTGTVHDPDHSELLQPVYTVASTRDPAHRIELRANSTYSGGWAYGYLPEDFLRDGEPYEVTLRTTDPFGATSPPSEPCRIITDFTRPDRAPGVSSPDYPDDRPPGHGGVGVPGKFTFTPNEVGDVAGYYWGVDERMRSTPANPDGTLTVEYTPDRGGPHLMRVYTQDRAGNLSPVTEYAFSVKRG